MASDGLRIGSGSPLPPSVHLVLCQSTNYIHDQTATKHCANIKIVSSIYANDRDEVKQLVCNE